MDVEINAELGSPLPASGGFVTADISVEASGSKAKKMRRNIALCLDTSGSRPLRMETKSKPSEKRPRKSWTS